MKFLSLIALLLSSQAWALDPASITKSWQKTPYELYLSAKEAFDLKYKNKDSLLLIDVRNEAEVHYTGIPTIVDANIPYRLDSNKWKMKKKGVYGTFVKPKNPNFVNAVENLVKQRGFTKDVPIIVMCATGARAPFAVKALHKHGFKTVYSQIEGFEGSRAKTGPNKGRRVINGWKNENLPWTYDLVPEKMYFNFMPKILTE